MLRPAFPPENKNWVKKKERERERERKKQLKVYISLNETKVNDLNPKR